MYEISRDIERILVGKEELNGICDRAEFRAMCVWNS